MTGTYSLKTANVPHYIHCNIYTQNDNIRHHGTTPNTVSLKCRKLILIH